MSIENKFDKLRKALVAATEGEWRCEIEEYGSSGSVTVTGLERVLHDTEWADPEDFLQDQANGEFIALAHNHLPDMLAALDQARAERDLLEEAFLNAEGIMPDGELGPTKHNMAAWLAARDTRMKREGAADALLSVAHGRFGDGLFEPDRTSYTKDEVRWILDQKVSELRKGGE